MPSGFKDLSREDHFDDDGAQNDENNIIDKFPRLEFRFHLFHKKQYTQTLTFRKLYLRQNTPAV